MELQRDRPRRRKVQPEGRRQQDAGLRGGHLQEGQHRSRWQGLLRMKEKKIKEKKDAKPVATRSC